MPISGNRQTLAAAKFMQHYGYVRALAVRFAPWPGLVDDIFQQVFVEYMEGAERFDLDADLPPLLLTITRRTAMRLWRQAIRNQPVEIQALAEHVRLLADTCDESSNWEHQLAALRSCLSQVPKQSQLLVDWYYFQNISTDQIADRLAMKVGTVQRAISRLREKLRKCMQGKLIGRATYG